MQTIDNLPGRIQPQPHHVHPAEPLHSSDH